MINAPSHLYRKIVPDGGRNILPTKLRAGTWAIGLHFPREAGNGYVLLVSMSGIVPGVGLPDGRHVPLNLDAVTTRGLNGLLAPILTGQLGALDANARGLAGLDVSTIPGLGGLRVWFVAATLDPAAPLGVRTIADPVVVVL